MKKELVLKGIDLIGFQAMDVITGVVGIITGYCEYINGCNQYQIQPKSQDSSKHINANWVDTQQVRPLTELIPARIDVKFITPLGSIATDRISGYRGKVVARVTYIDNFVKVGLVPKSSNNEFPEVNYYNQDFLYNIETPKKPEPMEEVEETGGPQRFAPN